jgi:site-specific DNA-methyltransferase (adenine-specific)
MEPIFPRPSIVKALILKAFLEVRRGYSADVIIADPAINLKFIETCRRLGATLTPFELNHGLFNLRRSRELEEFPTTNRVRLKNQDEYRFAAEIAARYLERREGTSLDRIICDPNLATEFDRLAQEIAPGFSAFEYRFTALSLRKRRGFRPEIVSRVIPATQVSVLHVAKLDITQVPKSQGIYIFFFKKEGVLYLGEAKDLRERIRKHIDHSDRKELARWLWDYGSDDLYVEIHVLPAGTKSVERKAVELELIKSRKPRFNIAGRDETEI